MWFLVWLNFVNGSFEYYDIGVFYSAEACQLELRKAEVLITSSNTAVACLEVSRDKEK